MTIDGEGNARVMANTVRLLGRYSSGYERRVSHQCKLTMGLKDKRFGRRDRNYPEHVAYSLSGPAMDEVARIWADELQQVILSH